MKIKVEVVDSTTKDFEVKDVTEVSDTKVAEKINDLAEASQTKENDDQPKLKKIEQKTQQAIEDENGGSSPKSEDSI